MVEGEMAEDEMVEGEIGALECGVGEEDHQVAET